ncbi:phage portal protein [Aquibaculum sediminis]|uniref:phage portal protein n=1 Tax=Aquibaculum sediminis TaxID=3231907 RepID=UPI003454F246
MLDRFRHRLARAISRRSFEAAAGGRRWEGAGATWNQGNAILAGARRVAARASHQAANNPYAASALRSLVANIVGAGIVPQAAHPDEGQRRRLNERFALWTDAADLAERTDFYGLQAQAVRCMLEEGEAFILMRPQPGGLRLQLIHPDQVPTDLHQDLAGGGRIRGGIEFDSAGRRRAYHVYEQRPGEGLGSTATRRIPAADVIHLFEPVTPGQVRGVSRLAPVLLRLHELDAYEDAEAMRHKVQALFAGFIRDTDGSAAGFADGQGALKSIVEAGLQPGTLYSLPPGADVSFSNPGGDSGAYASFVKGQLRAIAAGLGTTYEQLTGDLEGVNYSSIRAGLVEFRRQVEQLQWSVIIPQLCQPVWDRWLRLAILAGELQAPDFEDFPERYRAGWVTPGVDWIDPLKDIQAEVQAIGAGLKSRREAVAGRGLNVEALDAEIAADRARAEALGLNFEGGSTERSEGNARDA